MNKIKAHQIPAVEDNASARWDIDETTIYLNKATGEITGETIRFDHGQDDWVETPIQSVDAEAIAKQSMLRLRDGSTAFQVR